jgi:hypothetical protein
MFHKTIIYIDEVAGTRVFKEHGYPELLGIVKWNRECSGRLNVLSVFG